MMWPEAAEAARILKEAELKLAALHNWDAGRQHDAEMRMLQALIAGLQKKAEYTSGWVCSDMK